MEMTDYEQSYITEYEVMPQAALTSGIDKMIKAVLLMFAILVPAVIVFTVPGNIMTVALLAYINCLIIGIAFYRLLRKGTVAAMVPLLFLPYLALGWSVTVLYFAISIPEMAYYQVNAGTVNISLFDSGVKCQMVVMVFLLPYLAVVFRALRYEGTQPENVIHNPLVLTYTTTIIGITIIFYNAIAKVFGLSGLAGYAAEGLFNYFWGLMFITGAFIKVFPLIIRFALLVLLGGAVLIFTIANARGVAVFTVAMLIFGTIFFSELTKKTKIIIMVSMLAAFPMYMMISNTTRILSGGAGYKDLSYRLSLLKEWRAITSQESMLPITLRRLNHIAGHSVVTRTPSERPFHPPYPVTLASELVTSLVPGHVSYYTSTGLLLDYGFRIIQGATSVEVSIIGGLWIMGGWPAIFAGGVAIGLLHCWLIKILQRASRISKMKAFIYFSVYSPPLIWASNYQPILYWKITLYAMFFAFVFYQVLRFTMGDPGRDAPTQDNFVVEEEGI